MRTVGRGFEEILYHKMNDAMNVEEVNVEEKVQLQLQRRRYDVSDGVCRAPSTYKEALSHRAVTMTCYELEASF